MALSLLNLFVIFSLPVTFGGRSVETLSLKQWSDIEPLLRSCTEISEEVVGSLQAVVMANRSVDASKLMATTEMRAMNEDGGCADLNRLLSTENVDTYLAGGIMAATLVFLFALMWTINKTTLCCKSLHNKNAKIRPLITLGAIVFNLHGDVLIVVALYTYLTAGCDVAIKGQLGWILLVMIVLRIVSTIVNTWGLRSALGPESKNNRFFREWWYKYRSIALPVQFFGAFTSPAIFSLHHSELFGLRVFSAPTAFGLKRKLHWLGLRVVLLDTLPQLILTVVLQVILMGHRKQLGLSGGLDGFVAVSVTGSLVMIAVNLMDIFLWTKPPRRPVSEGGYVVVGGKMGVATEFNRDPDGGVCWKVRFDAKDEVEVVHGELSGVSVVEEQRLHGWLGRKSISAYEVREVIGLLPLIPKHDLQEFLSRCQEICDVVQTRLTDENGSWGGLAVLNRDEEVMTPEGPGVVLLQSRGRNKVIVELTDGGSRVFSTSSVTPLDLISLDSPHLHSGDSDSTNSSTSARLGTGLWNRASRQPRASPPLALILGLTRGGSCSESDPERSAQWSPRSIPPDPFTPLELDAVVGYDSSSGDLDAAEDRLLRTSPDVPQSPRLTGLAVTIRSLDAPKTPGCEPLQPYRLDYSPTAGPAPCRSPSPSARRTPSPGLLNTPSVRTQPAPSSPVQPAFLNTPILAAIQPAFAHQPAPSSPSHLPLASDAGTSVETKRVDYAPVYAHMLSSSPSTRERAFSMLSASPVGDKFETVPVGPAENAGGSHTILRMLNAHTGGGVMDSRLEEEVLQRQRRWQESVRKTLLPAEGLTTAIRKLTNNFPLPDRHCATTVQPNMEIQPDIDIVVDLTGEDLTVQTS